MHDAELEHMLVLVVDDDPDMRDLVAQALERDGYDVCTESAPENAFGRVKDGKEGLLPPIDLVVTDLRLEGASGMELVAALRGLVADAPVLLMSGFPSTEVRDLARAFDVQVLAKPFAMETLGAAVKELLERQSNNEGVSRELCPPPRRRRSKSKLK